MIAFSRGGDNLLLSQRLFQPVAEILTFRTVTQTILHKRLHITKLVTAIMGFTAHMERVDAVVMGRGTYDIISHMRPWYYAKPVVVLSRSLCQGDIPEEIADKVEVMNATPEEAMRNFATRGWARVYVDGGSVIKSFLRAGLISDLVISRLLVLIGDGISLFGPLEADLMLEHEGTTAFASGMVQSTYRIKR